MWTLIEYILHRYLFHMKTSGYWCVNLRALPRNFFGVTSMYYCVDPDED